MAVMELPSAAQKSDGGSAMVGVAVGAGEEVVGTVHRMAMMMICMLETEELLLLWEKGEEEKEKKKRKIMSTYQSMYVTSNDAIHC